MKHLARRSGFSLLEVILALAILTGAIAVLGELVRLGLRNAELARDISHAQLLCETKLAEITSGAVMATTVSDALFETDPEWRYGVQIMPTDMAGLVAIEVAVYRPEPLRLTAQRPGAEFRLVRWMTDPGVELSPETAPPANSPSSVR